MKLVIHVVLLALVAMALARPQTKCSTPIIRQRRQVNGDGSYSFRFETGDGISRQEFEQVKQIKPIGAGIVLQGVSYTFPDGSIITRRSVDDRNGILLLR